jgi:hypothetical protein
VLCSIPCKAMYWASLHLVHTLHRRVSQARATVFGKRRSSFSTRTKVRLTLVSEGLAGTAYAWIFFSDGMLDRTSEVTEGTDDTYTMPSRVESQRRPTLTRSKPTNSAKRITQLVEQSAKAKTLVLKVDELGTYHILLPLVPGAKV